MSETEESDFWAGIAPSLRCIEHPWNKMELHSVNTEYGALYLSNELHITNKVPIKKHYAVVSGRVPNRASPALRWLTDDTTVLPGH